MALGDVFKDCILLDAIPIALPANGNTASYEDLAKIFKPSDVEEIRRLWGNIVRIIANGCDIRLACAKTAVECLKDWTLSETEFNRLFPEYTGFNSREIGHPSYFRRCRPSDTQSQNLNSVCAFLTGNPLANFGTVMQNRNHPVLEKMRLTEAQEERRLKHSFGGSEESDAQKKARMNSMYGGCKESDAQKEGSAKGRAKARVMKMFRAIKADQDFLVCTACYARTTNMNRLKKKKHYKKGEGVCGPYKKLTCTAPISIGEVVDEEGYVVSDELS